MDFKVFLSKLSFKTLTLLFIMDIFKVVFWPSLNLMVWAVVVIFLDLLTGVIKSAVKGEFVISSGLKKTVLKLAQYFGAVMVCFIISNVVAGNRVSVQETLSFFGEGMYPKVKFAMSLLNNLVLLLIIYTETLSNLENLLAINETSPFSKFVIKPLHKLISLALIHNSLKRLADTQSRK